MTKSTKPRAKAKPVQTGERLQKYMAHCGVASRRAAEELITAGRVDVNGHIVTELGTRIDAEADVVRVDGERLVPQKQRVVLLLNKPTGFLCAQSDPESRPLVYRLVPTNLALRTIGRLDFNTEGVLLFTNDGDLAERLGHARYSVQRTYEARVRGVPSEETLAAIRRGVRLEDGPARAESIEVIKATEQNAWVRLTLVEGRNREVRRLLERVGHPVVRLRRVAFAGLGVQGLKQGEWRLLADEEIESLETRGHVGAFELPPDPRRRSGARELARADASREAVREVKPVGTGVGRNELPPKPRTPRSVSRGSDAPPRSNGPPPRPAGDRPASERPARGRPAPARGRAPSADPPPRDPPARGRRPPSSRSNDPPPREPPGRGRPRPSAGGKPGGSAGKPAGSTGKPGGTGGRPGRSRPA